MAEQVISRREFARRLIRAGAAAGLLGASGVAGYANLIEPLNYEITATDILIPELPARFENFRLTQLTDLHHSSLVSLGQIRRVVELAQTTRPDLFVLTGDYTTARRSYIEPCAEALSALKAPEGVWAVLGNHDHRNDPELTRQALRRAKINTLDNANTLVTRGAEALQLIGIGDWSWADADWRRARHGVRAGVPQILLSHEPHVADLPEVAGVSLIISGHTHGGQINLPFFGPPAALFLPDLKYLSGLYRVAPATQLFVSRGTGMIGLPLRIGARPEIAVLTLKSDK
jgi:predicted MPP superfamily phosphohydrolase